MELEAALYTCLSAHEELEALVSTRIYPDFLPSTNTQDAVTFELDDTEIVHAMGTDPGLQGAYYKFKCFGETKPKAKAVAVQVKAALQDFSGSMGGTGGVTVERIFLEDEYDEESAGGGNEFVTKTQHFRIVEFMIWYHA